MSKAETPSARLWTRAVEGVDSLYRAGGHIVRRRGILAAALLGCALGVESAAAQEPVDGVCNEIKRNGCSAGRANDDAFPDHPTVYVWRCDGLHGGVNSGKCSKFVPVDGMCDETTRNGCSAGIANDEALADIPTAYLWRCDGLHGGANSEKCIKFVPVDGACDETTRNGCSAGTANDAAFPEDGHEYAWRCDGVHGGANSQRCAIDVSEVPIDGVCNEIKRNGCSAGTPNDAAFPNYPTIYVWRCDGQYGGADSEKCVKYTAVDGGWSDWSACSTTACATSGTRTRTCNNPAPAHGGQECLKLDGSRGTSEVRGCAGSTPVDGGWSAWSNCSATACGASGTQTRTCDNPAPGCGGSSCSGPSSRTCTGNTPVDGGWSSWSNCSASACRTGGTRTRACNSPTPACGGLDCAGPSSQSCTGGDARNGVWETGTWGQWSACGGSVCSSSRSRSVTCTPPACGGTPCDQSSKPAAWETRACPSPGWQAGAWGNWSDCSARACGAAGTQTRTRAVTCPCGTGCPAASKPAASETRNCTGNTPRHGVWQRGEWGPWGPCSVSTCETTRSRSVTCAPPGCGGNDCDQSVKPAETETVSCSNPSNPQWVKGQWGDWSGCSPSTCGTSGEQEQTRSVSCPCGSTACPAPKPAVVQTRSCANPRCPPRDCSRTTLTWSSCSARASATPHGSSVTLNNTVSCRTGSATFACNDSSWGSATSATCTVTRTNGSCNNAVTNGCSRGTFQDVADTATQSKWRCVGSCDGTTARCSKAKQISAPSVSISVSGSGGRGTATAIVSGGTPPYRYSWSVSGAGSAQGGSSGASVSFSYRSGPASAVVDFSVNVTDSAGLPGHAEATWGTPPGRP